jgi:epsilon-lactone hydrolase
MSVSMTLTRFALSITPSSYVTETAMRRSLPRDDHDAPIPRSLTRICSITRARVRGAWITTLEPKTGATGTQLVYLHGGVYVHGVVSAHWRIISTFIRKTGATVTVPSYGLAPRSTVDDAYPFLETVYRAVLGRPGIGSVILAGDSCGAALAVGLAIKCRDQNIRPPAALFLFSPWVDATMTNPEIDRYLARDPMLAPTGMVAAATDWAGDRDPSDALISPINANLVGLPPMYVYQGGRDILLPDARRFAAKARSAGQLLELRIFPAGVHDFVGAGWTPEARAAFRHVAERIAASNE